MDFLHFAAASKTFPSFGFKPVNFNSSNRWNSRLTANQSSLVEDTQSGVHMTFVVNVVLLGGQIREKND